MVEPIESTQAQKEHRREDERPEEFHVVLPIRDDHRHCPPFGPLPSNIVTAIVLSFVGRKAEACTLLQRLSHTGRAYCERGDGLKGFVLPNLPHFQHLSLRARDIVRGLEGERFEGKERGKSRVYHES